MNLRLRRWASAFLILALAGCVADAEPESGDESEEELITADPRAALRTSSFALSQKAIAPASAPYIAHGDYVAANVTFAPIEALRRDVERSLGGQLKNRGEAHVTTLTPAETGVLRKKLSMAEIERIVAARGLQRARIEPQCVGVGSKGRDHTFFLVVGSPELVAVRGALADAYVAKGGARADFEPTAFFPHVTLGFTKRDLHESDGIKKNVASCPAPRGLRVVE